MINNDTLSSSTLSEAIYWTRPYFTRKAKQHLSGPCSGTASCPQLSTVISSSGTSSASSRCVKYSSPYFATINLANGEHLYIPLPQKHRKKYAVLSSN